MHAQALNCPTRLAEAIGLFTISGQGKAGLDYGTYTYTSDESGNIFTFKAGDKLANLGSWGINDSAAITINGASMDLLIGATPQTFNRLEP
jgi:hypothetical protein